jgi:hypothetical protein
MSSRSAPRPVKRTATSVRGARSPSVTPFAGTGKVARSQDFGMTKRIIQAPGLSAGDTVTGTVIAIRRSLAPAARASFFAVM